MPTIQISQIILRSGVSIDLPGAPTSLNPLTFSAGLLAGEMAFMTDTGRIYVGNDPSQGQPNYNRIIFPYQNVEVLTENSTDTLQKIVGQSFKEAEEYAYYIAALPTHTTDWENVIVPTSTDDNYIYRIAYDSGIGASIDYVVYDTNTIPIKTGVLTVTYFEGEAEPSIIDEATVIRRNDLTSPEIHQAANVFQQCAFNFIVAGPLGARYLSFQYQNRAGSVLSLRFRTSRPRAT